jgi:hypothetical protein
MVRFRELKVCAGGRNSCRRRRARGGSEEKRKMEGGEELEMHGEESVRGRKERKKRGDAGRK